MKGINKKLKIFVVALASLLLANPSHALTQRFWYGTYSGMQSTIISEITWTYGDALFYPYWERHTRLLCNNEYEDNISPSGSSPPIEPFNAFITLVNPGSTWCYMIDYYKMWYPNWGHIDVGDVSQPALIIKN